MQPTITRGRRRFGAAVVTSALVAGVLALTAPSASATTDVKTSRIAGTDRFATAADVARAGFPTGAPTVIVASGRAFPDALAGSSLGIPILLTEKTSLPSVTSKALSDLKATKAIILGGTAAVSDAVKNQIQGSGVSTTRVAGIDRYETAGAIASTFSQTDVATLSGKKTAIIATGKDFADALAGGPLASAPTTGLYPVLLVNETVPAATKKAIADLAIKQVVILGGTGAVSTTVQTELETETGNQAVRLAGTNRYGTATKIADAAIKDFGMAGKEVLLANARSFSDALAGGPLGALRGAPVLLTDQVQLNSEPKTWLASHSSTVATVTALGGSAAVSDSTLSAAEKAAETPPASRKNENYIVTPVERQETGSSGTVSYTAKVGTDTVDIVLVKCDRVSTTSAGDTVFANTNGNTIADGTSKTGTDPDATNTGAVISAVNGVPTNPAADPADYADAQKGDAAGTLTFDVDGPTGTASECVVPVVFNDADLSNSLKVPSTNPASPTEVFGTGGQGVFTPAEAAKTQFRVDVRVNNDDFNSFVGCTLLDPDQPEPPAGAQCQPNGQANYFYDGTNDLFQVTDGTSLRTSSLAEFETMLSPGDDVRGSYDPDPAGVSQFILYSDEAPEPPTRTAAPASQDGTGVHIDVLESPRLTVDSYRLYRVEKPASGCPGVTPALSPLYQKVGDDVEDNDDGHYTLTDPSPTTGKIYCYTVASVDDGDPGAGTTPDSVTIAGGTGSAAPTITSLQATSPGDNTVSAGDVHEFVFSEPMAESTARSATYTVRGGLIVVTQDIKCTDATVVCGLSADGKTMHVHLLPGFTSTLAYPVTITAATLMTDRDATPKSVDVSDTSNDTNLNVDTLKSADTSRPAITAVAFGSDAQSCSGFGQPGDVLKLTFGTETIALHVADPTKVSEAELKAILGPDGTGTAADDLAYATDGSTKVTASISGSVLTLTVVNTLAHGVENGDKVPGTSNSYVTDAAGNPQQAGTATMPAAAASCP